MTSRSLLPHPSARALRAMAVRKGVAPGQVATAKAAKRVEGPLTLILPLPPNQNREQGHWAARHRRKMLYFSLCDQWAASPGFVPDPPSEPFARVILSATMRMWSPMDPDNAKYRASKWPCDYLKSRGYIVNDTAKVITWAGDPEQVIDRKTDATNRLILTLTPLEAA